MAEMYDPEKLTLNHVHCLVNIKIPGFGALTSREVGNKSGKCFHILQNSGLTSSFIVVTNSFSAMLEDQRVAGKQEWT